MISSSPTITPKKEVEIIAQCLPESVLQEVSSGLLMYYDSALMRVEAEPEQGRLM